MSDEGEYEYKFTPVGDAQQGGDDDKNVSVVTLPANMLRTGDTFEISFDLIESGASVWRDGQLVTIGGEDFIVCEQDDGTFRHVLASIVDEREVAARRARAALMPRSPNAGSITSYKVFRTVGPPVPGQPGFKELGSVKPLKAGLGFSVEGRLVPKESLDPGGKSCREERKRRWRRYTR